MSTKTRALEADRILHLYGKDDPRLIHQLLERQFGVLTSRAQVLLGLCGIAITTTGFSGRAIASTGPLAQWLLVGGVALVLAGAAAIVWGILQLNWITQFDVTDIKAALVRLLAYRDRKTRAYRMGLILMILGLALYCSAISLMVLAPAGTVHIIGWGDAKITPVTQPSP